MTHRYRLALAAGVVVLGVLAGLFLGPGIAGCLGPLGVTAIQCASATGWYPTVGLGLPTLAGCFGLAALIANPSLVRPRTLLAVGAGVIVAGAAYLAFRPTIWTGPTSTGQVISLGLPLDPSALELVAILGGLAGLAVGWVFAVRQRA